MKQEILEALNGERQAIRPRYRAVMMFLGTFLFLIALEILHATLLNKHPQGKLILNHHLAFMVLASILIYIIVTLGLLLFRAAVVSKSLMTRRSTPGR